MRERMETTLIGYRNPRGLLAARFEDEGPLCLPNGRTMPADHPAWEEDDEVELEDLSDAQKAFVVATLESAARVASAQAARKAEEEETACFEYLCKKGLSHANNAFPKGRRAFEKLYSEDEVAALDLVGKADDERRWEREWAKMERTMREIGRMVGLEM